MMNARRHGRRIRAPEQRTRRWRSVEATAKPVLARSIYGWKASGLGGYVQTEPCAKVCFESAAEANPSFAQKAYRCGCGWWHLTHKRA